MNDNHTATVVETPVFSLDWPCAHGQPTARGQFRCQPEDFIVDEVLGFEPTGEGEHCVLHICKRGENSEWVARQIAELAGVQAMDVSYCGRKDRHAVTTQWFSIYLGTRAEADWTRLNSDSVHVLAVSRHARKLRRGDHEGNHFQIRLRQVDGERSDIEARLQGIRDKGVPNYFGEQRFGRDGGNLPLAQSMLMESLRIKDKQKHGLILSAARSYLFNLVLGARVAAGSWCASLDGEVVESGLPTGPLWGRGRSRAADQALEVEQQVLGQWSGWRDALEHKGLSQERRSLVMQPQNLSWEWQGDDLLVQFGLGSGDFATSLLREVMVVQSAIE